MNHKKEVFTGTVYASTEHHLGVWLREGEITITPINMLIAKVGKRVRVTVEEIDEVPIPQEVKADKVVLFAPTPDLAPA